MDRVPATTQPDMLVGDVTDVLARSGNAAAPVVDDAGQHSLDSLAIHHAPATLPLVRAPARAEAWGQGVLKTGRRSYHCPS